MTRISIILVLTLAALTASATPASAQFFPGFNPYMFNRQAMNNQMIYNQLGMQAANLGFATGFPRGQMVAPYYGGVNPYVFNNIAASNYLNNMNNPWLYGGGGYGYSYGYNPYLYNYGYGYENIGNSAYGVLSGNAQLMQAYGSALTQQEQARSMREQALQAQIDTQKKKFDFQMYVRNNTPTFSEEQAKIAKQVLKRIQNNPSPGEILNGNAINVLLDDLRKYPDRKVSMDPILLSEDVLKGVNVIKNAGNFGLLRNDGKFSWPLAFNDVLTPEEQKRIELTTQAVVQKAFKDQLDNNMLKDLRNLLVDARDKLTKKVNEIPTSQYLEAKRFLHDFDEARFALERGEAQTYLAYRKFIEGGKTIAELADYMVTRGLKFAPATLNDDASYRALYSAIVAYDVTLNAYLVQREPAKN